MKILIQVEYCLTNYEVNLLKKNEILEDKDILEHINSYFLDMSELDRSLSKGLAIGVIRE
jgi:hypothetical protein